MTFTEAAVEILRLVGRPLHYKKITELAIERNLLSHVGKAPELTMSSRLATMVKKDRGEEPIIKVKPGVFALRDFTPAMMALADAGDDDIDLSQIPETPPAPPAAPASEGASEEGSSPEAAPRPALPGSDVFPAEDDDDKPILAGIDDDDEEEGEGGGDRRGRRRRRRRGRGDGEGETAEAEGEKGEASGETEERRSDGREGREGREGRDRHDRDRHRHDRERDRERDRDRDRSRRDRDGRDGHRDAPRLPAVELVREPADNDLLGRDLADAVFAVLVSEGRPLSYAAIAAELVRRGRLVGEPPTLVPTIAAAVRADAGRTAGDLGRGVHARFRHTTDGVALYDWFLPRDAMYRERDVVRAAERHQETVRRAFLRKITDLPAAGFAELVATWLNAEGVAGLRGVRRPTSSAQEMHFAGTLRRGFEELRLAIVVLRSGQELTRERVVELRGSLHHYGNATLGWIVSTAGVPKPTREEATAAGATPIAVFDGLSLAEAMEARGVGMRRTSVPLSLIDLDTLDALRGFAEAPQREERREGRDGREERREGRDGRDERRERREERGAQDKDKPEASGETETSPAATAESSEAPRAEAAETAPAEAPQQERAEGEEGGSRRRRRRRRRRGGQDRGPASGAPGEGGADAAEDDELEAELDGEPGEAEAPAAASEAPAADDAIDEEALEDRDELHDQDEVGDDEGAPADETTSEATADDDEVADDEE